MARQNNNQFFINMTLAVCSTLDLSEAVNRCNKVVSTAMPDTETFFVYFDANDLALRFFGSTELANNTHSKTAGNEAKEKANETETILRYPERFRKLMPGKWDSLGEVTIVNRPAGDDLSKIMYEYVADEQLSFLMLRLELEEQRIGLFVIVAKGYGRFSDRHRTMVSRLVDPFSIALVNALQYLELLHLKEKIFDENRFLRRELSDIVGTEIIGTSVGLKNTMESVARVAPIQSPVLLLGETGVGKELIANAIHENSPRRKGPFIKVNSGAIPESLVDSELFGHEKGAFTGALAVKIGRFERANGGTIFLDEIGELTAPVQVRLLRVLQDHVIERVGAVNPIKLNIRIITATHRNLDEMVKDKEFREDLLFRLSVCPIIVPPLRQRTEDIPALVDYFINRKAKEMNIAKPELMPGTVERLKTFPWPGNIRELENAVERALINRTSGFLEIVPGPQTHGKTSFLKLDSMEPVFTLDQINTMYIGKILAQTGGKIRGKGGAAELLGINPFTLRSRMDRLGIEYGRKRKNLN